MESYAKIDKKMAVAQQIGLVHDDSNGETPNINDGTQFDPHTLERLILLNNIKPCRCSDTQIYNATHRGEHNAGTTFQTLHVQTVGSNIHGFDIASRHAIANITNHKAFPLLSRSENIVQRCPSATVA